MKKPVRPVADPLHSPHSLVDSSMTDSPILLRDATADDAASIAALLAELEHPMSPSHVPGRLLAVTGAGGAVILAIGDQDQPLGLMTLALYASLQDSGTGALITALVISSAARRRGIGKLLVDRAFEWARENGCSRLTVTSAERRTDAHAFYPSAGLPYTGRRFATAL